MPKKRLSACLLLACGALGLGWLTTKARASSTTQCPQLLVLGSRGSGTGPDSANWGNGLGLPGMALVQSLQAKLGAGQVHYEHNAYVAVGIIPPVKAVLKALGSHLANLKADIDLVRQAFNGFGPLARLSWVGAYSASVHQGEGDLVGQIGAFESTACSTRTKLVLTGYSQGAQVTGDVYQSLPPREKSKVLAIVLFGDPHYNPNDSSDRFGYNAAASQRWTHNQGILGHRKAFNSASVLSFCHRSDPICQGLGQIWHLFGQHNNYPSFGEPQMAAGYIAKLLPGKPSQLPDKWPVNRNNMPDYIKNGLGELPQWSSCNKRWCIYGLPYTSTEERIWFFVIVDGEARNPSSLAFMKSPTNPDPRTTLIGKEIEDDSGCFDNCPRYKVTARDANQLLAR